MSEAKSISSVYVTYARNGASTKANALGMRPMQERAYAKRGEQYLLTKEQILSLTWAVKQGAVADVSSVAVPARPPLRRECGGLRFYGFLRGSMSWCAPEGLDRGLISGGQRSEGK